MGRRIHACRGEVKQWIRGYIQGMGSKVPWFQPLSTCDEQETGASAVLRSMRTSGAL